jgi:hypothetical protein
MQNPTRFVVTCEFCGQQLDIRAEDVSHCIAGFVPQDVGDDIKLSDVLQRRADRRAAESLEVDHERVRSRAKARRP